VKALSYALLNKLIGKRFSTSGLKRVSPSFFFTGTQITQMPPIIKATHSGLNHCRANDGATATRLTGARGECVGAAGGTNVLLPERKKWARKPIENGRAGRCAVC
jgi:hypothetical protein